MTFLSIEWPIGDDEAIAWDCNATGINRSRY